MSPTALAEALADVQTYIKDRTGNALVDVRALPGHPDCTAYQITGATWWSVQREIDAIMLMPGVVEAHFRHPARVRCPDLRWRAAGYARRGA